MNPLGIFTKVFGTRNDRLLKRFTRIIQAINDFEPNVRKFTDSQLRARTQEMRKNLVDKTLRTDDAMVEAFAVIRESMDRNIGIRQIFNPEDEELGAKFDPDKLDDAMLQAYDAVQQRMISTGESWRSVEIPVALYDAVRALYPESRPPFRARCFDVQLIGGLVLSEGKIAEMATGEGKTFVAPLACFFRVLQGYHCHVVTVNDYLVRRDANWVRPAFEALGLSVGYIQSEMEPGGQSRRKMYECDITYGTNSEFGFDYLRDNMKERVDLQVQGPLDFAIVDEVDSILIDEARTPLIISGAAHDDAPKYRAADLVARKVIELHKPYGLIEREVDQAKRAMKAAEGDEDKARGKEEKETARKRHAEAQAALADAEKRKGQLTQYFEVEMDKKSSHLTHEGIAAAQEAAGVGSFYVGTNMEWPHLMEQSIRAHAVYEKDKDYVVERGQRGEMEVVIVDEYTGRKMVGRQWSDGLHQAIEAKERVAIKQETQTLATITLQNFFKLYKSLSGMTGTAQTEAEEFNKIYRLEVVTIPTNRERVREDHQDRVYRTSDEKWEAILDEIKLMSDAGRPVLVGTTSVEKSETISRLLTHKHGIRHEVLNAKQHEREAQIVALAGQQHVNVRSEKAGNVTIATNMAGRGTDIKLSADSHTGGGLHVIGTERHTARRIDNQLRGRSGRQGDPGSSRFYVSLQDDLLKMFMPEWSVNVFKKIGMEYGEAIESNMLTKGIVRAQKKVEERNFLARKNLLEYDEVMDKQRSSFYGMRQKVLEGRDIDEIIWRMIGEAIQDAVTKYITADYVAACVSEWSRNEFDVAIDPVDVRGLRRIVDIEEYIKTTARTDAEASIPTTLGEYMGEDPEDSRDWDTKGLSAWAQSRYAVTISQAQLRKMTRDEVEECIKEAAYEKIATRDCAGIVKYLEPLFAQAELSRWAQEKFGIEVGPREMIADERDNRPKASEEIVALIEQRARQAYARREIEYPVDHTLTFVTSGQEALMLENPYAADYLRQWAKAKYDVDLSLDHIRQTPLRVLRDELIGYQELWIGDGKVEKAIDAMVAANVTPEQLAKAASDRWGVKLTADDLAGKKLPGKTGAPLPDQDADGAITPRDVLIRRYKTFLRSELTQLEQFVLIQIFDQSWKDHLYAMDILKAGIGLQSFAEKDPRILYKKEGYRYFEEMMAGVRDKVTDLIFKARVVGQTQAKSAYKETAAVHETQEAYGVAEAVGAGAIDQSNQSETSAASEQPQGEAATRVKTIVNEAPKVGRNDLCPCGSGKKYKKCHGVNAT